MLEQPREEIHTSEHEPRHEELRVGNLLQMALMQEYLTDKGVAPDQTDKALDEWENDYAAKFAPIYKRLLEDHRTLVQEWYEDPDKTAAALIAEIKPKLY